MGSFYYVVGTRLPNNESILKPGSHCTFCGHPLKSYDLIPVISYLSLGGKCRYCHKKLSNEYLLYELFTGTLFLISYIKFGISYEFFISLIISSLVVLIFITDFKQMIILDSPLVISIILIFILKIGYYNIYEALFSILFGLLSFITMILIRFIGNFLFKKESLGGGDIKFSFITGMILGYKFALISLVLSTFLAFPYAIASVYLKKDNEVPFGPFLVCSLFIIFFFFEKFQYLIYLF
jgi:prepilin signal peptidase PulO-like enzyme (type II secretory pathway)